MARTHSLLLVAWLGAALAAQQPQPVPTVPQNKGGEQKSERAPIDTPLGPVELLRNEQPATTAQKATVWVWYHRADGELRDHATWLGDLQVRYAERGIRIAVLLGGEEAEKVAKGKGQFAVGRLRAEMAPDMRTAAVIASDDGASGVSLVVDSLVDHVEALLAGTQAQLVQADVDSTLDSVLQQVGDGGDFREAVEFYLRTLPHSGRAHALAVLFEWWCKGDLAAARRAFERGLEAIGSDAVPLAVFADRVLRGDRFEPTIAKRLAMALAPVAAGAPEGAFTQNVYLRALLRAGQDRLAGRVVATLPKLLAGNPEQQLFFAETLMEAGDPKPYRDLAERAITAAEQPAPGYVPDRRYLYGARHKVMTRCGDPAEKIAALLTEYRGSDVFGSSLNNDAWYMVTQGWSMGRFDTLALAQVEEMQRLEGAGMSNGNKDTVALVLFLNGRVEDAAALQKTAAAAANGDPEYVGRLARFENVLAERRAAAKSPSPK